MTKAEAIKLFGRAYKLAQAVGVTPGAISQWPHELSQQRADLVLGAALRLGKITPDECAALVASQPSQADVAG